ncbi:MAG: nucleoside 2-deoxyribosyltransferase domain-containing protein [Luteolibacter sp.]|uniref:nucleoside 2-deoxyribosyltransferase n=1 Tax=Luteolibacter sp. TaxID=1962973 RepID=UPI0032632A2E
MNLYFAAPLFCQAERAFNAQLALRIEDLGYSVFLPQRDGVESSKPPWSQMAPDDRRREMFAMDVREIRRCDVFLFILDGRVPDEGACVELGIAFEQKSSGAGKHLVGLQTDQRAAFIGSRLNPMIREALDEIAGDEVELLATLTRLRSDAS